MGVAVAEGRDGVMGMVVSVVPSFEYVPRLEAMWSGEGANSFE